ncbi:hypothetical protein BURMUCF1_1461 [Burkholderia multivorans ATCC BAA-247]|nr:hypothetical protein BURMUCF1_1461 [Burkholderia multivorans ATCC BAA-247]
MVVTASSGARGCRERSGTTPVRSGMIEAGVAMRVRVQRNGGTTGHSSASLAFAQRVCAGIVQGRDHRAPHHCARAACGVSAFSIPCAPDCDAP